LNIVKVVNSSEVEIKPFLLKNFIVKEESKKELKRVSKKELKSLASEIGLEYSKEQIDFAKKIITAYLAKR
jgi:hypothetical protein